MLTNHAKLMNFFVTAKEVVGRKKLQKMIYILQKCDVPFEEKFTFHFYGPYSEELTLRIEEMCNLGFIEETKEEKSNYYQYQYQTTSAGIDFLDHVKVDLPLFSKKVDLLKEQSSRFLELVATMLYFDELPKVEVEAKVREVKAKVNYTDKDIEEAWAFIAELKQT
ncbi:uncharacterized protein YwgA [Natronobacillus azotifigens]|uniref:YwgA family protein n=1 Tax=Natronobacillus azotifigens TaxID=472978 RepID=A0A9J6RBD8_9BACI|nr:YwgA family protein [Natronobacillus azotifigens]MCZ0702545.1 YwgA family protein [Natronobacillus azotifigens]